MKRSHILLSVMAIATLALSAKYVMREKPKEDPRGKPVTIYPLHTVCQFFDMSNAGFRLIKNDKDRSECLNKVIKGTWELVEMETSLCKHKFADATFGKEFPLRHEWCSPKRFR